MTAEPGSLLKPAPVDCPCGCGRVGQPRKKAWRNGRKCVKNCDSTKCPQCAGSRAAKSSANRERAMARQLGARRVSGSGRGHGADLAIEGRLYIETTQWATVRQTMENFWEGASMSERVGRATIYHSINESPWVVTAGANPDNRDDREGSIVIVPFASLQRLVVKDKRRITSYSLGPQDSKVPIRWWHGKAATTKRANLEKRCAHAHLPGALQLEWSKGRSASTGQILIFDRANWADFLAILEGCEVWDIDWESL